MTECNQTTFPFEAHFSRRVGACFDGAAMTTDGGALLLRAVDKKIRLLQRVAACFRDGRAAQRIEHELSEMLAQRIYGLALGYEDLNDHEELRHDPRLGVLSGKRELEQPLAGKSTLNRLELAPAEGPHRYHKIRYSGAGLDALLVEIFWKHIPSRRERSCWIWTSPTCRCMGSKKRAFSTATMAITVICRYTSSAVSICCARGCGPRIRTPAREVSRKSNASWRRFAGAGRGCASFCGQIPAVVAAVNAATPGSYTEVQIPHAG